MFYSKYLPVNVKRQNSAVYTTSECYPADLLLKAEEALSTGKGLGSSVVVDDNNVSFISDPNIRWTVPDVYLACNALHTAEQNNFSYYTVCDEYGTPQLFISKAFKKHRVIVLAFTFQSIIITKPNLLKRAASMIDHTYPHIFCVNFFQTVQALEANCNKYLSGIIVDRDTEDEAMIVSPMTTSYADDNIIYDKQVIEDYRKLLADENAVTETVMIQGKFFARKNVTGFEPVTRQHASDMVTLYDNLSSKKNNYTDLVNTTHDTLLYVSTNLRYLVHAKTFECVVIKNMYVKRLLQQYLEHPATTLDLMFCWEMAGSGE